MANIIYISFPTVTPAIMVATVKGYTLLPPVPFFNVQVQYPDTFWIESDGENDQLCTTCIEGQPFPTLKDSLGNTHKAQIFELQAVNKSEGDRSWHPTSKPRRPIM